MKGYIFSLAVVLLLLIVKTRWKPDEAGSHIMVSDLSDLKRFGTFSKTGTLVNGFPKFANWNFDRSRNLVRDKEGFVGH